ncbi:MAG: alpha/beta hydrolase [Anaerolineales bacterium]|nr:alpha/beta hydrolase [Anaerolineales bacterium]
MPMRITLIKKVLRKQFEDWEEGSIQEQRHRQENAVRLSRRLPLGIEYQTVDVNGIPSAWFTPSDCSPGAILYLHGGAYCLGSINTHREMVGRMAEAVNKRLLVIEYRLAPEHPYPAALEDAQTAWQWLLDQDLEPKQLFLAGDSAGGGLVLALLLALRDAGRQMPAGAICLSPWTDLTMESTSAFDKAAVDPILNREHLAKKAHWYAGDFSIKNPLISPLYGDFSGLPPLLFQVGSDELLLDDSTRAAETARTDGVEVTLEIYEEMFHVFQMVPFLPATKKALQSIHNFIKGIEQRAR